MSVPQSNFRVSTPSAWFVFHDGTGYKIARSNGRTFIAILQRSLRNSTELASGARTYDGSMVRGFDINVDAIPGSMTLKALWAYLNARGAGQVFLDAVASAARGHTITPSVMGLAADIAIRGGNAFQPPYPPFVPGNSLLPRYGQALPGAIALSFTVANATDAELQAARGAATPAPRPAPAPAPDPVTAEPDAPTSEPPPAPPPAPIPVPSDPLPTGERQTITTGRSGITAGPVIVAGIALAAFAAIAYSLSSGMKAQSRMARGRRLRHNPSGERDKRLLRAYRVAFNKQRARGGFIEDAEIAGIKAVFDTGRKLGIPVSEYHNMNFHKLSQEAVESQVASGKLGKQYAPKGLSSYRRAR
jgi:hypothetical protein